MRMFARFAAVALGVYALPAIADGIATPQQVLAAEVRRLLGERWVPTAVGIARVESSLNCRAVGPPLGRRHGFQRAMGLMQVLPSTARSLGYSGPSSDLLNCDTGALYGALHMRRCLEAGATTTALMARCHVGGSPHTAGSYANEYVRRVRKAR